MPAGDFISEVVISLVFLEGSAKSYAGLHARVGGIWHCAERIHRLEVAIAKVAEDIAVEVVRTGPRDDVEFLDGFLRDRGAHAVHRVVRGIGAIYVYQV